MQSSPASPNLSLAASGSIQTRALGAVTGRDARLAHRIDAALAGLGLVPAAPVSARSSRPVQMLELAIDALDIPAIRPFWKAVMGLPRHLKACRLLVQIPDLRGIRPERACQKRADGLELGQRLVWVAVGGQRCGGNLETGGVFSVSGG